ncbi:MAG: hypothetical protein ACFFCF_05955 [Promethearchaeota archaeon]
MFHLDTPQYRSGYALTTEVESTPSNERTVLLQKTFAELQELNKNLQQFE